MSEQSLISVDLAKNVSQLCAMTNRMKMVEMNAAVFCTTTPGGRLAQIDNPQSRINLSVDTAVIISADSVGLLRSTPISYLSRLTANHDNIAR